MIYLLLAGLGALLFVKREEVAEVASDVAQEAEVFVATQVSNWTRWDADFKLAARVHNVPWTWLKAIAMNESSLGSAKSVAWGLQFPNDIEKSKSTDGKSWGLMQVTLSTAKGLDASATEAKLNDPKYSINLGAKYIAQMSKRYPTMELRYVEWVIKSYNQGPGNTDKERSGLISKGYADEYWERFKRNLQKVEA